MIEKEAIFTETTPYSPFRILTNPELQRMRSHLALIVVVNSETGEIWTAEEQEDKPQTGKRKGDINVISETAEDGETALQTISYGLIDEFLGENVLNHSDTLRLAWFAPQFYDYTPPNTSIPLSTAIGICFYEGKTEDIIPGKREEVDKGKWVPLDKLLNNPRIRHSAKEIVSHLLAKNVLNEALTQYQEGNSLPFSTILSLAFRTGHANNSQILSNYYQRTQPRNPADQVYEPIPMRHAQRR